MDRYIFNQEENFDMKIVRASLGRFRISAAVAGGLFAAVAVAMAGDDPARPEATATAKAAVKAADVDSIDSILKAMYDVISGAKGKPRDWDRFRGLCVAGARLIPCSPKNAEGKVAARVMTVEEFIERASEATERSGFYEREVARKTDRFGHIAQVFSTYESRREPDGEPFDRGINSVQLLWDESRWWIVTIYWDRASPDQPIPAEYQAKP